MSLVGLAAAPAAASAAPDPDQVQFGLYGCRLVAGETLPNANGDFICPDADYTHGNLGKNWNELDLVPHRLTASANQAQTYTIAIAADRLDVGRPGYDLISVPTVNTTLSTGTCSITAGPESIQAPGQGGADQSIYRLVTITQGDNSDCVFDYYERLALGSHLWPGSSLHSNLLNQDLTTSGVGSREVPIPVNEITAQGFSKTMSASTGTSSVWNITKNASPLHLDYDTCAGQATSSAQGVTITVSWTKNQLTAGTVTLVANMKLDNPSSRPITVSVEDKLYSGNNQATQVGSTYNSGAVVVPANSSRTLTDIQNVPANGATHYNDVAVATYSDPVVDPQNTHPIGTLTATADADLQTINTPNDTATITDTEQITGNGLSFSIDSVSLAGGTFSPAYAVGSGDRITGPIAWSRLVSGSGSAVFTKTVYVAGPLNTTGTLSDTATLADAVGTTPAPSASASTSITARACIQGTKFNDLNGNGSREGGEPGLAGVTIYVDLNSNGAFDVNEPSTVTGASGNYSISTATIPDGTYPLREVVPAGQVCTFPAPNCTHTITVGPGGPVTGRDFGNFTPPAPVVSPVAGASTPPAVTPPTQVVSPAAVVSGRSALFGPKRCVTRNFVASVTGRQIAKVQFYINNRLVATRTKRVNGRFSYLVKAGSLSFATKKLTAKVTYVAAAKTKAKTMSFTFSRCAKAAVSQFTG